VELGAEHAQRPGRHVVRGADVVVVRLVRGLEVGPEDEGGPVHQENLIAGADGLGRCGHGVRCAWTRPVLT
jgi:hypothetical protein